MKKLLLSFFILAAYVPAQAMTGFATTVAYFGRHSDIGIPENVKYSMQNGELVLSIPNISLVPAGKRHPGRRIASLPAVSVKKKKNYVTHPKNDVYLDHGKLSYHKLTLPNDKFKNREVTYDINGDTLTVRIKDIVLDPDNKGVENATYIGLLPSKAKPQKGKRRTGVRVYLKNKKAQPKVVTVKETKYRRPVKQVKKVPVKRLPRVQRVETVNIAGA